MKDCHIFYLHKLYLLSINHVKSPQSENKVLMDSNLYTVIIQIYDKKIAFPLLRSNFANLIYAKNQTKFERSSLLV